MQWIDAFILTLKLSLFSTSIALAIGVTTAILAWRSNYRWAYFLPLLMLAVPTWLLAYYLSEHFGYTDPWLGASLSLGICSAVYPHSIISSSLSNRASRDLEALQIMRGKSISTTITAAWPSLRVSLLPSIAIVMAEVFADFGVANFYGINTVTMLMYNTWASTWSIDAVVGGMAMLVTAGFVLSRFETQTLAALSGIGTSRKNVLYGILAVIPTVALIGFGVQKSIEWINLKQEVELGDLVAQTQDTLFIAAMVLIASLTILALYQTRLLKKAMRRFGLAMYSIPGIVIGSLLIYFLGAAVPLLLLLIVGISLRYFGLLISSVAVGEAGSKKYFEVIEMNSRGWWHTFRLRTRLLFPSIVTGASMIVLDVFRELPISMVLQPYDFQTLALRMSYISKMENPTLLGHHSLLLLSIGILFSFSTIWSINVRSK